MAQDNSGAYQVAGAAVTAMGNYAIDTARNRKQWKYQQRAMQMQDQYNRALFDYQNAYNTPTAQMQRLQQAGLNPRLVYGGSAGPSNTAAPMESLDVPVRQAAGAHIPEDLMFKYLQVRQMDAQYKATMQNIDIAQKRGALMDIEQGLSNLKLFRENLRSKNYKELAQAELDTQKFLTLRSQELFQNERTKGDVMDQLQQMRQKQMTGIDLDNAFKQHRNDLSKLGIYTSDHPAFRVLIQAANRMNIDLGDLLAEGAEKLKYLLDLGK